MNLGDTLPAYEIVQPSSPLNEGRGMNLGDTGPKDTGGRSERMALNEGRGMNLGDTR